MEEHPKGLETPGSDRTEDQLAEAVRVEHELGFLQAVRLYPKAIGWTAFVSLGIIMLAFDPQVMGNLFSTSYFTKDFGHKFQDGVSYITSIATSPALFHMSCRFTVLLKY